MGKNFVGWLELKLPASTEAGASLRIDYADWTPTPGRWATFNQRDEYVTRAGAQSFRSRFNYHGFRYAHVTGLNTKPQLADATGYFIRTAYARAAEFESSNDLLNRIYKMVAWTYENLSLGGYVVDCPTRERLGYGGDAGTSLETGLFNFDTGGLYTKWASNWRDAQAPTGDLPYTAPNYQDQGGGGPHVERLRRDHALAGVSHLWRPPRAGNELPHDAQVAGVRRVQNGGPHSGAL